MFYFGPQTISPEEMLQFYKHFTIQVLKQDSIPADHNLNHTFYQLEFSGS